MNKLLLILSTLVLVLSISACSSDSGSSRPAAIDDEDDGATQTSNVFVWGESNWGEAEWE